MSRNVKIFIESPFNEGVEWVFSILSQYADLNFLFVTEKKDADFTCGEIDSDIYLSVDFWRMMETNEFSYRLILSDNFCVEKEKIDYLATAFYFLNCLWERTDDFIVDKWGRSSFSSSIWTEFGFDKPFLQVNIMFNNILNILHVELPKKKTEVFISHDIDAVYSAWKEDGASALKQLKPLAFFKIIYKHIINQPSWFNFNEIIQIEKKYGVSSTFFWLVNQDVFPDVGKNADYDIHSHKMKLVLNELENKGATIGIHKSISSSSLREEVNDFPVTVDSNRYHYLKYQFVDLIQEVNESTIKMDASLGYADMYGYRNGYSLPFSPFDFKTKKNADFIEVPLVIMDGTFSRYLGCTGKEAIEKIQSFIDENNENAVISILWHNSHFTNFKYKGYPVVFESTLDFLSKRNIYSISPAELIKKYFSDANS